jgi:cysteinyl-tRNA synthetase
MLILLITKIYKMSQEYIVYDSITKTKVPLNISRDKPIKWYSCGPTVYDSAHLGHARNFMTFDIIKRILEKDGYTIEYVMNITDIDDKIIDRVNIIDNCMTYLVNNHALYEDVSNMDDKQRFQLLAFNANFRERVALNIRNKNPPQYNLFPEFIKLMESDFWTDMNSLNIMAPNIITRVTENIDNIINYIQTIMSNGYAYELNNSIYFDSEAFIKSGKVFRPLCPNISDENTIQTNEFEKKSPNDFALWKACKEDEEVWYDSPFGKGRPGWHIECSVMATNILSDTFDIHSGGIDLMFPHHNNEIVQAQSHQNKDNNSFCWVKYFLHSGQLTVDNKKMAKSLGNYITIKDFLIQNPNPNVLRMLFLLHDWSAPLNYNQNQLEEAKYHYKKIIDFIKFVELEVKNAKNHISSDDQLYMNDLVQYKQTVIDSLHSNFSTQSVIKNIHSMINNSYIYMDKNPNYMYINNFISHMKDILNTFGLDISEKISNAQVGVEDVIDLSVNFRSNIRKYIKENRKEFSKEGFSNIFKILDNFRDIGMKQIGISVEDRDDKNVKWSFL